MDADYRHELCPVLFMDEHLHLHQHHRDLDLHAGHSAHGGVCDELPTPSAIYQAYSMQPILPFREA